MKANFEHHKAEFKKLSSQGTNLFNAMQDEQFPDRMEAHFTKVLKKDYHAFKKTLPSFSHAYQHWYSQAQVLIKLLLPDRLADFIRLYEQPKNRREVRPETYVIEDYLKNITITTGFDKKIVVSPDAAIPVFQQQLNILNAVEGRFDSILYDIQLHLQAEILDAELASAALLVKNKQFRSAAIICGIVLEKYLAQLAATHNLKIGKRNPSIGDLNDLLKKQEVYDFYTWRFVQGMGDFIKNCYSVKKGEPHQEDLADLLAGVDKVIKSAV
ncbi:hypothetical protein J7E50_02960 [Pedobacter sp. ISL-68]|uniref:hypothetical protein n=1 Tax=unclassified Pedobacter TaxID=2628915 RepID=UPI001BEC08E6|nr:MULTISPECIES: hypothetical protein [unclassified Pedobacter]MBT2560181.1 hypothetical protein [Pedobacter sp. ISL-64]MBT2589160.1 hypothetical protein [Pedobacter sp. ISL-68]